MNLLPCRLPANRRSRGTVVAAVVAGVAGVALTLAGALAGLPAQAADAAATDRCLDAADDTALLACRQAVHADTTRALRQAVSQLQRRFRDDPPEHLQRFNAAQQAWRQYSQAECRFRQRESVGGAAYPAALLACATDLSRQRLHALQAVIDRP